MKKELIDVLECPYDQFSPLEVIPFVEDANSIKEGFLLCHKCNRWYPIQNFIVSIMPDELRDKNEIAILDTYKEKVPGLIIKNINQFNLPEGNRETIVKSVISDAKSEIETRDTQAATYIFTAQRLRGPTEIFNVKRRLNPKQKDIILDMGCGVGRLTCEVANSCVKIVCADFSLGSLKELQKACKALNISNYLAVQCDVTLLPFRNSSFDKVLFADVLQHITSDNLKRRTLQEIYRVMPEDGVMIIEAYNYNILKRLHKKQIYDKTDVHTGNDGKTGYHSNNTIYYYNFEYTELKDLLGEYFRVEELRGFLFPVPFAKRFIRNSKLITYVDLVLQKTPLAKWFGNLLLAKCKK